MSSETSKYLKFGGATVFILLMLGYLAYTGVQESKSYYVTIKELRGLGDGAYTKRLRVAGNVQPGSIKRSGTRVEFVLVENDQTLSVVYSGTEAPPDTFKDNSQALADGSFGRDGVFHAASAEFTSDRLLVNLGDNGEGKTTLLRSLASLTQPTRGKITVLGATDLRAVCGQIGYMAHPSLLYDEMSAMENLRYFARLYEICDDATCARVITAVGLDPALARPVAQYSQGMRQRLSLARAILHDPKILLPDEPFSNVDVQSARAMAALLAKMRDSGKSIFVVTHQASLLENLADEFVWIEAGQVSRRTSTFQPAEAQ